MYCERSLAGDAAHRVTPRGGNGLAMAVRGGLAIDTARAAAELLRPVGDVVGHRAATMAGAA
jgi:2-polyprenyl-6-methoxyphenol hydroxylase-like FAD-dependent oxidoreductase